MPRRTTSARADDPRTHVVSGIGASPSGFCRERGAQPFLPDARRDSLREIDHRLEAPRLLLRMVLRDVGQAVREERVERRSRRSTR